MLASDTDIRSNEQKDRSHSEILGVLLAVEPTRIGYSIAYSATSAGNLCAMCLVDAFESTPRFIVGIERIWPDIDK